MLKLLHKSAIPKLMRQGVEAQCLRLISTTEVHSVKASLVESNDIVLANTKLVKYLESLTQEFYALRVSGGTNSPTSHNRMKKLNAVVESFEQYKALQNNLASQEEINNEKDEDMRKLLEEENQVYSDLIHKTENEVITELFMLGDEYNYPSLIFEVNSGAGGQEAMLFAKQLFDMYTNFFDYCEWDFEIIEHDQSDIGGLRNASVLVNNNSAFNYLQQEAGVHRVQRVPETEKSGRIHTSTVSVTVIPRPADINIQLNPKDLKIETKRASGAGGQHVNTTDSAVRIVHLPTGLSVECQSDRSQIKNRENALKRLQAKLFQSQYEQNESTMRATKRAQQGNLNRNEKIRTYNFVQDRITDHRLQKGTVHNLQEFLEGREHLSFLVERLMKDRRKAYISKILETWNKNSDEHVKHVINKQKSL